MRESPRIRRLRSDQRAMERLREESSIIDYTAWGNPFDRYLVRFQGQGFYRPEGTLQTQIREHHEVAIELGASYPRMMPELRWKTPIFQPNISAGGVVCLGGYGTYWVPSLNLDELCEMLWDMIRYKNFDVESPYNRDAALWARQQRDYRLPIDQRPIRDRLAEKESSTRVDCPPVVVPATPRGSAPRSSMNDGIMIIDAEVVEESGTQQVVDDDILFID